jgi:hypothetical protein
MRGEIEREMGGTSDDKSQPTDDAGSRRDPTSR